MTKELAVPQGEVTHMIDISPLLPEAKARIQSMVKEPDKFSKEEVVTALRIISGKLTDLESSAIRLAKHKNLLLRVFRKWKKFMDPQDQTT